MMNENVELSTLKAQKKNQRIEFLIYFRFSVRHYCIDVGRAAIFHGWTGIGAIGGRFVAIFSFLVDVLSV